jgi:two-component system response regulator YesN
MYKMKVMLVDDESLVLEGYRKLFDWEKHGFTVVCDAGDGMTAVSLAHRYKADIILMDINIPLLSGLDAISAIRPKLPDAGFIIISGYDNFEYAQKAIRLGVVEYMLKPVKYEALGEILIRIRQELTKKRYSHTEPENTGDDKRIYKIISYLHEHITDSISLKKLADEFFLHPVYISQLFKQETGLNYHEYLIRLRVDSAKRLLSTTDLSISQIAETAGFQDYRGFSVVFKRLEKVTPSMYRDQSQHVTVQIK